MKAWLPDPETPPVRRLRQPGLRACRDPAAAWRTRRGPGSLLATCGERSGGPLNGVTLDERLGGEECNPPVPKASRIVGLTWILAYENGGEANRPMRCGLPQLVFARKKKKDHTDWRRSWATCLQATCWSGAKAEGGQDQNCIRPRRKRLALAAAAAAADRHVSHQGWGCSRSSSHWHASLHMKSPPEPPLIPPRQTHGAIEPPRKALTWKGPSLAFTAEPATGFQTLDSISDPIFGSGN